MIWILVLTWLIMAVVLLSITALANGIKDDGIVDLEEVVFCFAWPIVVMVATGYFLGKRIRVWKWNRTFRVIRVSDDAGLELALDTALGLYSNTKIIIPRGSLIKPRELRARGTAWVRIENE